MNKFLFLLLFTFIIVLIVKPIPNRPYDLSNIPGSDQYDDLINFSNNGDIEKIKSALKQGININQALNSDGDTLLINTLLHSYKNKFEIVKLLLDNGADISIKNKKGLSALSYVCYDSNILKLLIDQGVKINCQEGYDFFISSVSSHCYKIIVLLLENGIPIDCTNKIGFTALMKIVYHQGKVELLKFIIKKGANVNKQLQPGGLTPLMIAARLNNVPHLKLLFENGADVNLKTVKGINALDIAIEFNNTESIEILKKNGAVPSQETENKNNITTDSINEKEILDILMKNPEPSKLHKAIAEGDYETVNELATVYTQAANECDRNLMSPIFYAVIYNNTKAAKRLLQVSGINRIDCFGMSPSRWAHQLGRQKIIELFKKYEITKKFNYRIIMQCGIGDTIYNFDIDFLDKIIPMIKEENYDKIKKEFNYFFYEFSKTDYILSETLFVACYAGDTKSVEFLINKGIDINSIKTGHEFVSPLMAACLNNQYKMAEFLIEKGANIYYENSHRYSIIHQIIIHRHFELAELFIKKGLELNKIYKNGQTPLMLACEDIKPNGEHNSDSLKMIKLLLKNNADPNLKSGGPSDEKTALMMAFESDNNDIANILIDNGAAINAADAAGITPLMIVARRGNIEGVKLLLKHNVNINACDEDGENAIFGAIMYGHNQIVKLLIDNKININVLNNRSQSLSQIALKFKNSEAAKLLGVK